ncbi:MAG: hypothetical protein NZ480_05335 [Bdellovibrionaceae bacterium]|nr:hypothetical protein [Pseudobdellovibrionaceae bacterium]MDW8190396.1 hypothetical protein [Pseudobdellovibrionaceae bacterium]
MKEKNFTLLLVFALFFIPYVTHGYHHFFAMGYASCMTCHYHPQGNGPLNDYGRALFATELSSRWYVPRSTSDDELGEKSGFFWGAKGPQWLRPHIKLRYLQITDGPNSSTSSNKSYAMQREVGMAFLTSPEEKTLWVTTFTFHDPQGKYRTSSYQNFNESGSFLKELYYRRALGEERWLLIGMQDQVFGIRDVNHTLFSRRLPRLTQYDQSLGITYFLTKETYEWTVMGFMGNINEPPEYRMGGVSTLFERQLDDQTRLGFSFLTKKNNFHEIFALAPQARLNLNYDAAFSFELGFLSVANLNTKAATTPTYLLAQMMYRLTRGWNFIIENEIAKVDSGGDSPIAVRTYFGLLAFVIPRGELRFNVNNGRTINFAQGQSDAWQLQTQLHLSL